MRIMGVPINLISNINNTYTDIKNHMGFLQPRVNYHYNSGAMVITPYYIPFSKYSDLILKPYIGKKSQVISIQYRNYFNNGEIKIKTSLATTKYNFFKNNIKINKRLSYWHLEANTKIDINDKWRIGMKICKASNSDYMKYFSFLNVKSIFTTTGYLEGFLGKLSYIKAEAISFQGINTKDNKSTNPVICPQIKGYWFKKTGWKGSYFKFKIDMLSLVRKFGMNVQRLILITEYNMPYKSNAGAQYHIKTQIRNDFYRMKETSFNKQRAHGIKKRFLAKIHIDWRLPFYINTHSKNIILFTPIASLTISQTKKNHLQKNIKCEDNTGYDYLDKGNMFLSNRFSGYDIIDYGSRVSYGVQISSIKSHNEVFIGQSCCLTTTGSAYHTKGNNFSDYIVQVESKLKKVVDVKFKGLYDRKSLKLRSNSLEMNFNLKNTIIKSRYNFLSSDVNGNAVPRIKQIVLSINVKINEYWSLSIRSSSNIIVDHDIINQNVSIFYKGDFFNLSVTIIRSAFKHKNFKPSNMLIFRFHMKDLGNVEHIDRYNNVSDKGTRWSHIFKNIYSK